MGEAADEEVVDGADRHAQSVGELPFVFVVQW